MSIDRIDTKEQAMIETSTANAIYWTAEGTIELVELDEIDTVYEVIRTMTEDDVAQICAGESEYRTIGRVIEIGDRDTFQRIATR